MAEPVIKATTDRQYGAPAQTEQDLAARPLPTEPPPLPTEAELLPKSFQPPPAPKSMMQMFTPGQLFKQKGLKGPLAQRQDIGSLWSALAANPTAPQALRNIAEIMLEADSGR